MTTAKYDLGNIEHNSKGWDAVLNDNANKLDAAMYDRLSAVSGDVISKYAAVYLASDATWRTALADGAKQPCLGLAIEGCSAAGMTFRVQRRGIVTNAAWTWASAGLRVYLSDTTAGLLTATKPAWHTQVVGITLSATSVLVWPGISDDVAAVTLSIMATEALAANAFVNIYNYAGTAAVRNACAAARGYEAHGFVLKAVLSGSVAAISVSGLNPVSTVLTAGMTWLSTTAGVATNTPPTADWAVVQPLGIYTASGIEYQFSSPIYRGPITSPITKPLYLNYSGNMAEIDASMLMYIPQFVGDVFALGLPAITTGFVGTISSSGTAITFSSGVDAALCHPGSMLVAAGQTMYIIGMSGLVATAMTIPTALSAAAITSVQNPIFAALDTSVALKMAIFGDGTPYYAIPAVYRSALGLSAMNSAGAYTLTDGATIAVDWNNGATQTVTLTATGRTVTMANPVEGQVYRLIIVQDAIGSRTITTWPTIKWAGVPSPTLTATAGKTDIVTLIYANGGYYADCNNNF
jgi:hypothetical protein